MQELGVARRGWGVLVALVLGASLAACGDDGGPGSGASVSIVATTSIWADVAQNLACDGLAEVTSIVPPGGDPHAFEPSLADRKTMQDAALIVANGESLEGGLGAPLESAADDGTPVLHMVDLVGGDRAPTDERDDHGDHAGLDPHIWQDPLEVASALPELADRLVVEVGLDADAVAACLTDYQAELLAVDAEIESLIATLPVERRKLVTNHVSLGYFAHRYELEILGTVIASASTLAEARPAHLEELAGLIAAAELPAIFSEIQHGSADAETLAERLGVEVVSLYADSLGPPGSGADTYVGLMRTNAQLIVDGLG